MIKWRRQLRNQKGHLPRCKYVYLGKENGKRLEIWVCDDACPVYIASKKKEYADSNE